MLAFPTIIFLAAVLLGGILLFLINRPKFQRIRPPEAVVAEKSVDLVHELLEGEKLSGSARRDWLDRLLAAQQSGEKQK